MTTAPKGIHRALPHSVEAEQGVLGSMLISPRDTIDEVLETVDKDYFYVPAHQTIFDALVVLWKRRKAIDLITFTQFLDDWDGRTDPNQPKMVGPKRHILSEVGGAAFVTNLLTFVPTAANIEYYLEIVKDKHILRQIIRTATDAVRRAYEDQDEPWLVLDDYQANAIEIGQGAKVHETLRPIKDVVPDVKASIEAIWRKRGKPIGISTGFTDLDRMMGGFQKGRTHYVAARPAMGKSSLATEFVEHVAIENAEKKRAVAIFSVEMTAHELTEVILCRRAEINLVRLRDGFFSKEGLEELSRQGEEVSAAPIYIDDQGDLSIYDFRARARRAVRKFNVELIIIDYIQRMKSTSRRALSSREQELNEIAQGISSTAKELQVPIVVLAQLNRETEKRPAARPELSHLRESGSMEAEAHFVGLLYRPSYYVKNDEHLREMAEAYKMPTADFARYTELIIAKQRRGPVGTVKLKFTKEYARFEDEDTLRPLYSNDPSQRQQKETDAAHTFLASVKEVFPNAQPSANGDEE
jgi:replicative DNA helicase